MVFRPILENDPIYKRVILIVANITNLIILHYTSITEPTMDPVKNPFSPGAGTPPPALVGRRSVLDQARITLARIKAGRSEKSALLVGLRGVGKTVLLRTIYDQAIDLGYQAVFIETPEHQRLSELLVPPLREVLSKLDRMKGFHAKVKYAMRVFRSFLGTVKIGNDELSVSFGVEPERGVADSGNFQADLNALFIAMAEAAVARGTAIALIIDEMQYLHESEFGALITSVHAIGQKQLPLVVIGAGLPQLVGLAGKAKSYAERLFHYPQIGPLEAGDAKDALCKPVQEQGIRFEIAAVDEILKLAKGYPYFLQEWGYEAWNHAKQSPITLRDIKSVNPLVIKKLDENFFRVRFDRLTPSEKRYLRAMAALGSGPHRSGDIAELLGLGVQSSAPVRSKLIQKGMIYSPAHGDTAFTVPLFDQFMVRTMPFPIGRP